VKRILCIIIVAIAVPVWASESAFPNKPGKKSAIQLVVGVQSGAATAPPEDKFVGADANSTKTGAGDYGFVAPAFQRNLKPKRRIGYDPAVYLGNKRPKT